MFKEILQLLHVKQWLPLGRKSATDRIYGVLWLLIIFTVFSGAIRKWVLGPGALGNVLLLMQLVLPLLFYYLVYKSSLPKLRHAPAFWIVYVGYLVLTALNPMNHTPYHGIFGLVLHSGYWLLWLAYLQKGRWLPLERLVPLLLVILIVEFILAGLQYNLPGTHILNIQAGGEANDAIVGDAVRVSGTFSYIGGFQVMLPLFACLAWLMMLQRYTMGLVLLVLGMGLVMAFMSGSRGAVGFFILYTGMAFLLSGNMGGRLFKLVVQGALIGVFIVTVVPTVQQTVIKSYDNFMYRVENSDEVDERLAGSLEEVLNFRGDYPVFGVGLGATYQGANALFGTSTYVQAYGGYESELARIILEGGYILFFLRLILLLVFLKNTMHLPLLAKAFFVVVYLNSMVTFNVYQGIFFVLGVLLVDRGYYLKQQRPGVFYKASGSTI